MQALYDQALIEESAKKSSLVWLKPQVAKDAKPSPKPSSKSAAAPPRARSQGQAQALWHVWLDGAVTIVAGGGEQPLPVFAVAGKVIEVCVRSKDKGGRLVAWLAQVDVLAPGTTEWEAAATALHAERLNLPEGDKYRERWAAESTLLRLKPLGDPLAQPDGSGAARPVDTDATTLGRQPKMIGGLPKRSR